jgi:hypothetical protein
VLGSHSRKRRPRGWAYLVVLVAGEGPEEDLGTWRRAAGRQRRPPSRRHERARTMGVNGRTGVGLGCRIGSVSDCPGPSVRTVCMSFERCGQSTKSFFLFLIDNGVKNVGRV